jgi:hypothetical protein
MYLNGCKKDEGITNTIAVGHIFPLKVGNTWIIQKTNYDTVGNIVYARNDTIRIHGDTLINNEKWYLGYGIVTNRNDGFYDYQEQSASQVSCRYKFPAISGMVSNYRNMTDSIVSISDTVVTMSGKYICYHYKIGIMNWSYGDWYLSPNIGIIKGEFYNTTVSGKLYKSLQYELVKAIIL